MIPRKDPSSARATATYSPHSIPAIFGTTAKTTALLVMLITPMETFAEYDLSFELLAGDAKHRDHSYEGSSSAIGLRIGYRLNPYFGLEASYQDFGKTDRFWFYRYFSSINEEYSTTALTFGLKGTIPLSNQFSVIGRAGVARWDHEYRSSGTSTDFPSLNYSKQLEDSGTAPYYGVGIDYQLNERFHVGLEYSIYKLDVSTDEELPDYTIKKAGVYLGYRF